MINTLRKKMLWICGSSILVVFILIFLLITIICTKQLNSAMDMLTDRISKGNGIFMPFDKDNPPPPDINRFPNFFTEETPFSTRYFAVWFDKDNQIVGENITSISSISKEESHSYAQIALSSENVRGWIGHYRYKVFDTPHGHETVFVDGSMNRSMTQTLLLSSGGVLAGSALLIFLLVFLLSGRVVKPIAESYQKQKQFITDASHELKTPLTLILTNLEIVETESGKNEWLDDIRSESMRMSALVHKMTALSRLDEDTSDMEMVSFSLSDMILDTISEFEPLIQKKTLSCSTSIQKELTCHSDEGGLRQVISILLDNAIKYCDEGGNISISLYKKRHVNVRIENSFQDVDAIELERLFDRFYRADKARTTSNSFGIGLSLAKSIITRHHGEISAYKADKNRIGFKIVLK